MATAVNLERTSEAEEIAALIARSRAAQAQIANYTQAQVDELIRAMVWAVAKPDVAEMIARHTVEETQLGNYDGKYLKIFRKTRATLMDIIDDKSVGVIEEDPARNLIKIAKPVGVIGALSPSTNPEATPVIKAISAVKGRNSIIVAPHPRAKLTNKLICDLMRAAIVKMGAPADLVLSIDIPSVEKTNELMRQCDRILATGGAAMVTAAYSRGTPALGVGAGNAVITVDETADLDDAAEKIRLSKTLDLAASCSSDNAVILVDAIHDTMLAKLVAKGGLILDDEQKAKLQNVIWVDGHINAKVVAQTPEVHRRLCRVRHPRRHAILHRPRNRRRPRPPLLGREDDGDDGALSRQGHRRGDRAHQPHPGLSGPGPQLRHLFDLRRQHHEAGRGHQHQPRDGQPAAGRVEQRQSVERHAPDLLAWAAAAGAATAPTTTSPGAT